VYVCVCVCICVRVCVCVRGLRNEGFLYTCIISVNIMQIRTACVCVRVCVFVCV